MTGLKTVDGNMMHAQGGRVLTVQDYEARIFLYKEQIGTGYIGIGRTLNEAKQAGVVPHGEWERWVEETTGLTIRQAQRCMQAALEIRDGSAMARLEMSKALLLLSSGLGEDERENLAERAAEDGASVRSLKEEIRKLKLEKVQEAGAAAEIRTELKKAQAERDHIRAQLEESISAMKEEREKLKEAAYQQGAKDQAAMNTRALEVANDKVARAYDAENELQARLEEEQENAKDLREKLRMAELKLQKKLREAEEMEKRLEEAGRQAEQLAAKQAAKAKQEMEEGIRSEVRDEFSEKINFINGERRRLEDARKDLLKALDDEKKHGSQKWDDGYRAGMSYAAELARESQDARARELDDLAGTLEAERKEWTLQMEQMRQDLEAAEAREAKRAKELAELRKEKAQAGMDAARGIRADAFGGLDLAAAVRDFVGRAGVLPQMGSVLAGMTKEERDVIRAQVDTVMTWVNGSRRALGLVSAEGTVE